MSLFLYAITNFPHPEERPTGRVSKDARCRGNRKSRRHVFRNSPGTMEKRTRRITSGLRRGQPPYCVRPLHFWSQYLVSRVFRYFVPVCVWKNRVHGTVIS
jgi:hypothetical protein